MMEALTYGMMPRPKMDICSSAPPEKRLNSETRPPDCFWASMNAFIAERSTPGVLMKMPMR
ncbi:hypothetical protein MYMAC_003275 [Corallococcus macrosporus DSM 14697]|uniref:Uncharacterized protein n=1 Tax=Corallococcus macrosporus DSM 14697 TaxID=1189310 RepID=A0A250JUU9_9BACT|nr:hypothetical protein MYMAC_003275 [Corallococcus macrosporus DSM 14697]